MTMNPNDPDDLPPRRDDLRNDRVRRNASYAGAWGWWVLAVIIIIGLIWWIGWGTAGGWYRRPAPVAAPTNVQPPANNTATQPAANGNNGAPATPNQGQANNR